MSTGLHYSSKALVARSAWMLIAAVVVIADYVAHADGGFPRVFGLSFVPSAVLIATALYFVAVTAGMTLGLMRHGSVALSSSEDGLVVRTAWFSKTLPWATLSLVGLDVRYGKTSHYPIVVVRQVSGRARAHTVDTRLLAEPLDLVSDWVGAAERKRVAKGGLPYATPSSGLAGYNARVHASDLAADIAAAKQPGIV